MVERFDIKSGEAQFCIAKVYEDGLDGDVDTELAVSLYRKSAELGHVESAYFLGFKYYQGDRVHQDYTEAAKWYRMAAKKGHPETQCELGGMYRKGLGVPKDEKKAADWLLKAADQGHPGVAYYLGEMYLAGEGVPADDIKAYMWFKIVQHCREFDTGDIEEIVNLKENMPPEVVEKAEALATDWIENQMMPNSLSFV